MGVLVFRIILFRTLSPRYFDKKFRPASKDSWYRKTYWEQNLAELMKGTSSMLFIRTPSLIYFDKNFSLCFQELEVLVKNALVAKMWRRVGVRTSSMLFRTLNPKYFDKLQLSKKKCSDKYLYRLYYSVKHLHLKFCSPEEGEMKAWNWITSEVWVPTGKRERKFSSSMSFATNWSMNFIGQVRIWKEL